MLSFAGLSLLLLGVLAVRERKVTTAALPVRFILTTADSARSVLGTPWPGAISTDGSTLVYVGQSDGGPALYSQHTDQLDARLVPGTANASQPLFSPDGQWVAFEQADKLKKVRLDGSAPINVADAGRQNGADWTTRNEIVFGAELNFHGLSKVSASGGALKEFARPDTTKGETDFLWPIALPDGKTVVFTIWNGSLASPPFGMSRRNIVRAGAWSLTDAIYAAVAASPDAGLGVVRGAVVQPASASAIGSPYFMLQYYSSQRFLDFDNSRRSQGRDSLLTPYEARNKTRAY